MISGLVLANCWLDKSESALKAIWRINGVSEVYRTAGIYDLIVRVEAENLYKLREIVRRIKGTSGILSTFTNIVYNAQAGMGPIISTDAA
jgi:DNA-binding Lrp family transcriptional regulator